MNESTSGWANSKTVGGVTELAVFAPIKQGRIPGERRTYEERLRFVISRIQNAVDNGLPSHLSLIPSIHFGQLMIVRPEHYLLYSGVPGDGQIDGESPFDDYQEITETEPEKPGPQYRSWLLTTVYFDGDLKMYIRDIAEFIGRDFDKVYSNCEDYPSADKFEEFWLWVRRYQVSSDLFHNTCVDLSVARIKQLEDFKRQFDLFVNKVRSPTARRVESMDELFDEFLRTNQQYASAFPTGGGVYIGKNS